MPMMYATSASTNILPQATAELVFVVPAGGPERFVPRGVCLALPAGVVVSIVTVAGKLVAHGFVQPTPQEMLDSSWPKVKADDRIVITLKNAGHKATALAGSLFLFTPPEDELALELTTELVAPGQEYTVLFVLPERGNVRRLEFETPYEWNPPGWLLTALDVGSVSQIMGVGGLPTQLFMGACNGFQTSTGAAGSAVAVKLQRLPDYPAAAVTARLVLGVRREAA